MPSLVDEAFARALPKAELHAHLTGSISRQTLHETWLRKRQQEHCKNLEDPAKVINTGRNGFVDITTFFPLFDKYIYALCNDVESVTYATHKVLQEFSEDGVRYLELRTTPRACIETGMAKEIYIEAVHDVIARWNQESGDKMEVYLIFSIDRRMTAAEAMGVVALAIKYHHQPESGNFVIGIDLCGNPTKGSVSTFTVAMNKARKSGLALTIHFAEVPQSGTDEELSTILSWHPKRLGHCIHVPPNIEKVMRQRKIGLEMCLSCNVLCKLSEGGFEQHHVKKWMGSECPIALSTDDVGVFGSPLSNEYAIAAKNFGLRREETIGLARQAASVALTGTERMMKLLDEFEHNSVRT